MAFVLNNGSIGIGGYRNGVGVGIQTNRDGTVTVGAQANGTVHGFPIKIGGTGIVIPEGSPGYNPGTVYAAGYGVGQRPVNTSKHLNEAWAILNRAMNAGPNSPERMQAINDYVAFSDNLKANGQFIQTGNVSQIAFDALGSKPIPISPNQPFTPERLLSHVSEQAAARGNQVFAGGLEMQLKKALDHQPIPISTQTVPAAGQAQGAAAPAANAAPAAAAGPREIMDSPERNALLVLIARAKGIDASKGPAHIIAESEKNPIPGITVTKDGKFTVDELMSVAAHRGKLVAAGQGEFVTAMDALLVKEGIVQQNGAFVDTKANQTAVAQAPTQAPAAAPAAANPQAGGQPAPGAAPAAPPAPTVDVNSTRNPAMVQTSTNPPAPPAATTPAATPAAQNAPAAATSPVAAPAPAPEAPAFALKVGTGPKARTLDGVGELNIKADQVKGLQEILVRIPGPEADKMKARSKDGTGVDGLPGRATFEAIEKVCKAANPPLDAHKLDFTNPGSPDMINFAKAAGELERTAKAVAAHRGGQQAPAAAPAVAPAPIAVTAPAFGVGTIPNQFDPMGAPVTLSAAPAAAPPAAVPAADPKKVAAQANAAEEAVKFYAGAAMNANNSKLFIDGGDLQAHNAAGSDGKIQMPKGEIEILPNKTLKFDGQRLTREELIANVKQQAKELELTPKAVEQAAAAAPAAAAPAAPQQTAAVDENYTRLMNSVRQIYQVPFEQRGAAVQQHLARVAQMEKDGIATVTAPGGADRLGKTDGDVNIAAGTKISPREFAAAVLANANTEHARAMAEKVQMEQPVAAPAAPKVISPVLASATQNLPYNGAAPAASAAAAAPAPQRLEHAARPVDVEAGNEPHYGNGLPTLPKPAVKAASVPGGR